MTLISSPRFGIKILRALTLKNQAYVFVTRKTKGKVYYTYPVIESMRQRETRQYQISMAAKAGRLAIVQIKNSLLRFWEILLSKDCIQFSNEFIHLWNNAKLTWNFVAFVRVRHERKVSLLCEQREGASTSVHTHRCVS